jgi:hypothetical protein
MFNSSTAGTVQKVSWGHSIHQNYRIAKEEDFPQHFGIDCCFVISFNNE